MAGGSRNLIVLSDGMGNSAATPFKTNVWRLYQALQLTDGSQVAVWRRRRHFEREILTRPWARPRDRGNCAQPLQVSVPESQFGRPIWAFGFSRGAFTIRVLVELIHHVGLVSFTSEAELNRNALAAYRAYRKRAFPTVIHWVVAGRWVRDLLISVWNAVTGARSCGKIREKRDTLKRNLVEVQFLGVWDTVVAYGLPVDELTQAVDKCVCP